MHTETDTDLKHAVVVDTYRKVATAQACCCGGGDGLDVVEMAAVLGYRKDDLEAVPEGANLGLGCGAPLEYADARPGEAVLDLGSGAGFDAFIARRAVGASGRVYGVDMTPEMVHKARANAAQLGVDNIEFRLGEIEHLPIPDGAIDLVISNCVLNLVPDKGAAFAEIARVLKPGGRMCVSDIVLVGELSPALRDSAASYAGCIGGAVGRDEYLAKLRQAGLTDLEVVRQVEAKDLVLSAGCCADDPVLDDLADGIIASITVRAMKPA